MSPIAPVSPGRPVGGGIVVVVVDLASKSGGIVAFGQLTMSLTSPVTNKRDVFEMSQMLFTVRLLQLGLEYNKKASIR